MRNAKRDMFVNAGFGLALAILAAIAYLYSLNVTATAEYSRMVERSHAVMLELEGLLSAMREVDNGEHLFIITGKDGYLEPYRAALGQIDRHLASLKSLTKDYPAQQKLVLRVEPIIRGRLAEAGETISVRKLKGFRSASRRELTDRHQPLMNQIRGQLAGASEAVRQHLNERKALKDASTRKTILVFIAGNILSFALLISPFVLLRKDITERRRTEEELRFSEARYRALYRDNPTMIATVDAELTILSVNPICASQLGYAREELEGRPVLMIFHEDDRPAVAEQFRNCLRDPGQVHSWSFRKVRRDGSVIWVEEIAQTVYDLSGSLNILVVCQDITERKRAEEERERLLMQLDAVLNSINEGVVIADLEGNVLTMNPAALAIYRYESIEHFPRQTHGYRELFELSNLEGPPLPYDIWPLARALRGERFTDYEVGVRRKDTGETWVCSYGGTPVHTRSGDFCLAVITLRDVTERKRAEEALIRAKQEWERTFDAVPDLIAILDDQYRITRLNRAMAGRLGRKPGECLGLTCFRTIHGTESPPEFCPHSRTLQDGWEHTAELYEEYLGGHFFVSTTPLLAPDGKMTGVVHVARDITERKFAEEEIKRLNTDLEARAIELEAANRELEAFNYTVAHDLRNPLTVINGYCEALRELCSDRLDEQCNGYLREAYDGTWRMNRLIEALLNFSRLAHVEPRREMVDLSAMAQEVAAVLRLADPGRRVTFLIANGVSADGDASLLRVVLDNLLGNAWKYSGTRAEGIIEFGTTEFDGKPAYFVRDNGAGFDMAYADKLFIPFQRLPGAEECRGFGIGLATVERIIRRHGGKVWAEAAPGKGATFWFTIPAGDGSNSNGDKM